MRDDHHQTAAAPRDMLPRGGRLGAQRNTRPGPLPARGGRRWVLLALATAWPAMAAQPVYDTERILEHNNNECRGVPACAIAKSPDKAIPADQHRLFAVSCPKAHPFAWHWDTVQHEHITVKLIGRTRSTLSFSAGNFADAPGHVKVFVGCSTDPFSFGDTGFMESRSGVPSKHRTFQGGRPQ